jgi:Na+-exporting ATPase
MAISFGIQSCIEGGFIAAVIALNVVVGVYQDLAAEKTMDSLRSLSSPTGVVSRDGKLPLSQPPRLFLAIWSN